MDHVDATKVLIAVAKEYKLCKDKHNLWVDQYNARQEKQNNGR